MQRLTEETNDVKPEPKRSRAVRIIAAVLRASTPKTEKFYRIPIGKETEPSWRVACLECGWRILIGEPSEAGPLREAHHKETGHTDIRKRFDMLDCDAGPAL